MQQLVSHLGTDKDQPCLASEASQQWDGRITAKKPVLKDTNKKKTRAWAKKHEQWTLDQWK
ncbi:hypothetical protein ACP3W2_24135, partial [Salmonella enterica]